MPKAPDRVPSDIAQWMLDAVRRGGYLDHDDVISHIEATHGAAYTYETDSGGTAIDRRILRAFKTLHAGTVEWDSGERCWHNLARPTP